VTNVLNLLIAVHKDAQFSLLLGRSVMQKELLEKQQLVCSEFAILPRVLAYCVIKGRVANEMKIAPRNIA
jgi:hypothetical protein